MAYFVLFYCLLFPTPHFSNTSLFTNEVYVITSLPNFIPGKKERYVLSSYHQNIYFDFPVYLAPYSKIRVYGNKQRNTMYVNSLENLEIITPPVPFLEYFARFRIELSQNILRFFPKSGALINALVIGNKYYMDEGFMEYIRASGLAHLFALSGLHVVIFVAFVMSMTNFLGLSLRTSNIISLPLALMYLFLGGFGISLQRAFLFQSLWVLFSLLRLPLESYKIFFLALFINLCLAPQNINSLSFQLSYISVFGIVFFYKFWYDNIKIHVGKRIASYLSVSLAVTTVLMPVLIWHFEMINIWAIFSSLVIVPMMPIILIMCFMALILSYFHISFYLLDEGLLIFYKIMEQCAIFFSEIPVGVIFFSSPKEMAIGYIVVLILITYYIRKKNETMD